MKKHIRRNSNSDPNMLIILLLILNAYIRKPVDFCEQEELHRNTHNNTSKDNDIFNEEGNDDVLNVNNSFQNTANSDIEKNLQYNADNNLDQNNYENMDRLSKVTVSKEEKDSGEVLISDVIPEYPNKFIEKSDENNKLIIYVPVVISEFEIEFPCESTIELDFPAAEINRISRSVVLINCKFIPNINKLFLSGYVSGNIEFSAIRSEIDENKNNIRHINFQVPFKIATEVSYFTLPIFNSKEEQLEIETLKPDNSGNDLTENSYISSKGLNEKIYCKLIRDEITEVNISERSGITDSNYEKPFKFLNEKMIIKITLKLIQEQQIKINK